MAVMFPASQMAATLNTRGRVIFAFLEASIWKLSCYTLGLMFCRRSRSLDGAGAGVDEN